MLYGKYPFKGIKIYLFFISLGSSDQELYKNIAKGNIITPENYSFKMKEIFKIFFVIDENLRFSTKDMLNLNFFKKF